MGEIFWLIDALPSTEGVRLRLLPEVGGGIEERVIRASYYGYLLGGEPYKVAEELMYEGLAEDAWVERWFLPPRYADRVDVTVFKTGSLKSLSRAYREGVRGGLRPVNTFPHPLVEALYRAGLRPLTKVYVEGGEVTPLPWSHVEGDPPVSVVRVYMDSGEYVVELDGEVLLRSRRASLIADEVSHLDYLVGIAEGPVYFRLYGRAAGGGAGRVWLAAGPFTPAEYFEWCRLSYTPLSMMGNTSIGRVLTTIEALTGRRMKYLIIKGVHRAEPFRGLDELVVNDRGGVIYAPRPGLYWRVCQLDFSSLYPSIIVKYNISGETVDVPDCSNPRRMGWTPHTVCVDREGVVPASIKGLLKLKDLYESLHETTGDELYRLRRSAVKWLLVASFGYLGFRNSFFGSVMAHETVTSTARHVMTEARQAVESAGYRVIHAIVDSLFVEGVGTAEECERLAEAVSRRAGIRVKVEAMYSWLYIPRTLSGSGAGNKYFGRLAGGGLRVKGLSLVRRDTPEVVRDAQAEALQALATASTPEELVDAVDEAREILREAGARVLRGEVGLDELIILRGGYRGRGGYVRPPRHAIVGDGPPYTLIARAGEGLTPADSVGSSLKGVDLTYYLRMIERASGELPTIDDVLESVKRSGRPGSRVWNGFSIA